MRTAGVALAAWVLTVSTARADLFCPEPTAQAGEVKAGQRLAQRFVVRNRGTAAVQITDVRTSCGCLKPQLDRRSLAPGEDLPVAVEINTLAQGAGPQRWHIRLSYQEAGRPAELTLEVLARLTTEVRVDPGVLTLSTDGGELTHPITVTDTRAKPFRITGADCTSPHLRARVQAPAASAAGTSWRIELELLAAYPEGRHDEVVHIRTDDPDYADLQVPVAVQKRSRGKVTATPSAVTLRGASQLVLLSAGGDEPVQVERIETGHPAIQCRWAPGPGPRATVRIQADTSGPQPPPARCLVQIHLKGSSEVVQVLVLCVGR